MADVLRLAVPPRHARVEAEARADGWSDAERPAGPAGDHDSASDVSPAADDVGDQSLACEGAGGAVAVGVGLRDQPSMGVGDVGMGAVGAAQGDRRAAGEGSPAGVDVRGWRRYARGPAFLSALGARRAAHAVWQALPGEAWADRLAEAALATAGAGRGALLVVPDQRDVDGLLAACTARLGIEAVVSLSAELGPAERYRRWLAVRRGQVRVVVGTRSAAFAPVAAPGLLAVWDDGDDLHAEPRAPYPHVRDVLVLRAHAVGAALLVAGHARTAEGQLLVESGWAREIVADRATVRAAMPRIVAQGESDIQLARDPLARAARLPSAAFERPAPRWPPAGRCWSRRRGRAMCRGCPALPAGRPPAAVAARGPSASPAARQARRLRPIAPGIRRSGPATMAAITSPTGAPKALPIPLRRAVDGAAVSRAPTGAAPAGHAGCAPVSSDPGARPRSSGARSPGCRSASPAVAHPCSAL